MKHELYIPRSENFFFDLNVDQMSTTSDLKQILTVITDKKVETARFKVLSAAVGKTAAGFKFMCANIPKWFVRIASAADLSDTANFLNNNLNSTYIEANTYPPYGSQDEIYRDLQQSSVLVIPPDETFRMEAFWAIAAGLPVLVPRRTAMADFLKKICGDRAEYFLYEPTVDDLSDQISKMLNRPETVGVTRKLKNAFQGHTEINESQGNFTAYFAKSQPYPQPVSVTAASTPPHRHSTDDGIGSIEDTSSQQSLSPQPASPESPVFLQEASTSQAQSAPVIARKRPLMPTLLCEANLEFEEKKMKMETTHLMERERQQFELKKERDQHSFKIQKREALLAEIKEFYELEKKKIMARDSADLVQELDEAYNKFKARLDEISDGSLQFMLSFLSEQDIDHFWQKYMAVDVEEVVSGILITPKMRSLAEKAGCTARIRLKIDKKEYELVKEILHDMSAVYTAPQNTWLRTIAYGEWEKYVLKHVGENQAKYLIEQSRYHHIVSQLRFDKFFFPSVVSYWRENMYTLPATLTEATEWAIMHHVIVYCEEHMLKIGNVQKLVQERFCKIGKYVFSNILRTGTADLKFADPYNEAYLFGLLEKTHGNKFKFINELLPFYAAAVYLSSSQQMFLEMTVIEILVKSFPIVLYFVSGIVNVKADFFICVLTNCVMKTYPVTFKLFGLQGGCLLETKYPMKFLRTANSLLIPQGLNLSQTELESISLYDIEAVEFIFKNASLIKNIVFDFDKRMPRDSEFLNILNQLVVNPTSSVSIKVRNSVELHMVARYIAFHRLVTIQKYKSSKGFCKPVLKYIKIEATQEKFGHIDSKTTQALVKVLSSLPFLESLSLSGFCESFIKELMETMLDNLAILKLKVLELSNNHLGPMFASVMMRSVKCLPFLEKLDVRNNKLGSLGSVELQKLHGKVDLCLDNNGVEDSLEKLLECKEVVKKTSDLVERSKQVKNLDDVKHVRDSFENVLGLDMSQASADNVHVLCTNLALFKNVVNLNLRQCNISRELGMVLAESCGHLLLLKYLDISSNQLGDDVVWHLGFKLPLLRNLRYANLHDTKISVRGIMSLLESVPEEQQKLVNVSQNLTTLKYILPHIKDTVRHDRKELDLNASKLTLDKLKFVTDLRNVRNIVIESKIWKDDEFDYFCKGVDNLVFLRSLTLRSNNIGDARVKSLISVGVEGLKELQQLDLSQNNIGVAGLWHLGKLVRLRQLTLSKNNIREEGAKCLSKVIKNMPCLEQLDLSHNKIGAVGIKSFEGLTWLRQLNLSHNNIGRDGAKCLSKVLMNMNCLEKLDLSHNDIGEDGAESLCVGMQVLTGLTVLNLSNNNLREKGIKSISKAMRKFTQLKHLDLSFNYIKFDGTNSLSKSMVGITSLEYLDLSHNDIGDVGAEIMSGIISNSRWIEYLDLSYNDISHIGADILSVAIYSMEWLKHLNFSNNKIGMDGVKNLSTAIQGHVLLEHLDLSNNNIGDDGTECLMEGMENKDFVKHLNLSGNNISDRGIESLSKGLEFMTGLEHFDLSNNDISSIGVECLSEGIGYIETLLHLDLSNNHIGDAGVESLSKKAESLKWLRHLNLSNNEIGDNGVESLSKQIDCFEYMDYLNLGQNDIGSHGQKCIDEALEMMDIKNMLDLYIS